MDAGKASTLSLYFWKFQDAVDTSDRDLRAGPKVPMVSSVAVLEVGRKVARAAGWGRVSSGSQFSSNPVSSIIGISPMLHKVSMKSGPKDGEGLGGEMDSKACKASQFCGLRLTISVLLSMSAWVRNDTTIKHVGRIQDVWSKKSALTQVTPRVKLFTMSVRWAAYGANLVYLISINDRERRASPSGKERP